VIDYGMLVVHQRDGEPPFERSDCGGVIVRRDGYVVVTEEAWAEARVSCARRILRALRLERLILG
jgi:hypothetical protein